MFEVGADGAVPVDVGVEGAVGAGRPVQGAADGGAGALSEFAF